MIMWSTLVIDPQLYLIAFKNETLIHNLSRAAQLAVCRAPPASHRTQRAGGSTLLPLSWAVNLAIALILKTCCQFTCLIWSDDWTQVSLPPLRQCEILRGKSFSVLLIEALLLCLNCLNILQDRKREDVCSLAARTTTKKPNYSLFHTKFPLYHSDHAHTAAIYWGHKAREQNSTGRIKNPPHPHTWWNH